MDSDSSACAAGFPAPQTPRTFVSLSSHLIRVFLITGCVFIESYQRLRVFSVDVALASDLNCFFS